MNFNKKHERERDYSALFVVYLICLTALCAPSSSPSLLTFNVAVDFSLSSLSNIGWGQLIEKIEPISSLYLFHLYFFY